MSIGDARGGKKKKVRTAAAIPISTNFWIIGRSRMLGSFFVNGSTLTSTYE